MNYNFKTLISILTIISFLFPTPVLAKLTPKPPEKDKKVEVITIKKGDTLWGLAKLYYKDPFMWKKFQEFNIITNPDLIYPGEKLVISAEDAKKLKEILEKRTIEVEEKIKEVKGKKELLEKKKEPEKVVEVKEVIKVEEIKVPVPVPVPVEDEALLKEIARLEQEVAQLKQECEKQKSEKEKEKEVVAVMEQMAFLKEEDEMLRASIVELEEKLSAEKTEVTTLKKEKQESEETIHFLVIGVMCGLVLLNAFK